MALSKHLKTIKDFEITGKTVLMRVDLNVPMDTTLDENTPTILEDHRIQESLSTIRYASEKGSKIILASHLGRPNGQKEKKLSLQPIAQRLAELLDKEVTLAEESFGSGMELMVKGLKNGQILLLENLRFSPGEEKNDPEFSKQLARFGEIYINDAFAASHRKHASTYGAASLILERGVGFLIEKEIEFLDPLVHQPKRPFYTLFGGAKVSDKIKTIQSLVRHLDGVLIGGAMAHAFWAAQGKPLPAFIKKPDLLDIKAARSILHATRQKEIPILISSHTTDGFDIGPETISSFSQFLSQAATIFWNGPLGYFEKSEYANGTYQMARFLAQTNALKIAGGGDTVSAIRKSGVAEKFQHLSTGGGATLAYLEQGGLPGIEILKLNNRELLHIENQVLKEV